MTILMKALAAVAGLTIGASTAHATVYTTTQTGAVANFQASQFTFGGNHYDRFILPLSGLDSSNAFTVSLGDTIDATVTLDGLYTIPTSQLYTNILQIFTGSGFPNENTGVDGTFTFYNGGTQVASFNYSSTTSGSLASYTANFPLNNVAFTFNSFTNAVHINDLATPATLDGGYFFYDLVSSAAPEPATWTMMLVGFGLVGGALRARAKAKTATA